MCQKNHIKIQKANATTTKDREIYSFALISFAIKIFLISLIRIGFLRKTMNKFGIAFILLFCSGCAYYKTPTTGPTALLELSSNASSTTVLYFRDDECTTDPNNPAGLLILLYGDGWILAGRNNITRQVAAEQNFFITYLSKSPNGAYTNKLCDATSSFYPKDGATYSIKLDVSYNNCHLEILRQVINEGKISYLPEESQRDLERVCRYPKKR